jgi:hypothetical protein
MRHAAWRLAVRLAPAAALVLATAAEALAAAAKEKPALPSFALPNMIALCMAAAMIAIACKPFKRT